MQYLPNVLLTTGRELKGAPGSGGLCLTPALETAVLAPVCPAEWGCCPGQGPPGVLRPLAGRCRHSFPVLARKSRMGPLAQTLSGRRARRLRAGAGAGRPQAGPARSALVTCAGPHSPVMKWEDGNRRAQDVTASVSPPGPFPALRVCRAFL